MTAPLPFDADYWQAVTEQAEATCCQHCGHPIEAAPTSTGWTHGGAWQGVRCPGMLCGATPAGLP